MRDPHKSTIDLELVFGLALGFDLVACYQFLCWANLYGALPQL